MERESHIPREEIKESSETEELWRKIQDLEGRLKELEIERRTRKE